MNPEEISRVTENLMIVIIIIIIIATVIFLVLRMERMGFWKWLVNLFRKPTPAPEPETDLDVTTDLDDNLSEEHRLMRNWLGDVVAEQRKTVELLDRIRGLLMFYTVLMVLGVVGGCIVASG